MMKKKEFKIEDSNVENIGSDMDKAARVAAAATEPAWADAGKKPGMQIWRIEKFKVKKSTTKHGTFYNDDSYICLNTYKKKDENGKELDKLGWDIHFWLGATTSQDEYGTAAYKTVELDDFLGGEPVQHREVSGSESGLFLKYFKSSGGIQLLEGGIESGFNKVEPKSYKPRLLHLKGKKNVRVTEVPITVASLNSGDVFILDGGLDIVQWQGKKAGMKEKIRGGQLCRSLDDDRNGLPEVTVMRQGDSDEADFFKYFDDWKEGCVISDDSGDDAAWEKDTTKTLHRLSDATGSLVFEKVAEKKLERSMLKSDDVFIVDIGCELFVWVGKGSSRKEKSGAMNYATEYLTKTGRKKTLPVTKIAEGNANAEFKRAFACW